MVISSEQNPKSPSPPSAAGRRPKAFEQVGVLGFFIVSAAVFLLLLLACYLFAGGARVPEAVSGGGGGGWRIGLGMMRVRSGNLSNYEFGKDCDLFEGEWVWDENYPLYDSRDCEFLDEGFRCSENGRPDRLYTKWRWQPARCNLPR